jgi:hypothetical protein
MGSRSFASMSFHSIHTSCMIAVGLVRPSADPPLPIVCFVTQLWFQRQSICLILCRVFLLKCSLLAGVRSIVYGLSDNTVCRHLELKVRHLNLPWASCLFHELPILLYSSDGSSYKKLTARLVCVTCNASACQWVFF